MTLTQTAPPAPAPADAPVRPSSITPARRAWNALRYIETHPAQWDQGVWRRCFAGHVARQGGHPVNSMWSYEIAEAARDLLGVSRWESVRFFYCGNNMGRLRRRVRRYFGPDPAGR